VLKFKNKFGTLRVKSGEVVARSYSVKGTKCRARRIKEHNRVKTQRRKEIRRLEQ
jgi:hypothetical protein